HHYSSLFFSSPVNHHPLHSFPTRRSSDLRMRKIILLFTTLCGALQAQQPPAPPIPDNLLFEADVAYAPADPQQVMDIVRPRDTGDRKSTRLNSSHVAISYAVFCLKKKKQE